MIANGAEGLQAKLLPPPVLAQGIVKMLTSLWLPDLTFIDKKYGDYYRVCLVQVTQGSCGSKRREGSECLSQMRVTAWAPSELEKCTSICHLNVT